MDVIERCSMEKRRDWYKSDCLGDSSWRMMVKAEEGEGEGEGEEGEDVGVGEIEVGEEEAGGEEEGVEMTDNGCDCEGGVDGGRGGVEGGVVVEDEEEEEEEEEGCDCWLTAGRGGEK